MGHRLAVRRVLTEMRAVGLSATGSGRTASCPDDPASKAAVLANHRLAAVGGFVPVVLHEAAMTHWPRSTGRSTARRGRCRRARAGGNRCIRLRRSPTLDDVAWKRCSTTSTGSWSGRLSGVQACLPPHVGTIVESYGRAPRARRLGCPVVRRHRSSDDRGTDPAALVRQPDRVVHTHLKDVDQAWAMRVQRGDVYTAAVVGGMYRPLGHGDVDIAGIVDTLEAGGYAGWYVLEQDTVLAGDPEGEGPVEDVRASVAYLRGLA